MAAKGFDWKGEQVRARIMKATAGAINETMGEAVGHAKSDHEWQNQTGTAEASVRVLTPATAGARELQGKWGSLGVAYVAHLEFWHGSFLRNAADQTYPTLKTRINRRLR